MGFIWVWVFNYDFFFDLGVDLYRFYAWSIYIVVVGQGFSDKSLEVLSFFYKEKINLYCEYLFITTPLIALLQ